MLRNPSTAGCFDCMLCCDGHGCVTLCKRHARGSHAVRQGAAMLNCGGTWLLRSVRVLLSLLLLDLPLPLLVQPAPAAH
jgi:hypothetical protein